MLIICCGMLHSGSTLQYQIASRVAALTRKALPLGYGYPENLDLLEKKHRDNETVYLIKLHGFSEHHRRFDPEHTRLIYSYRDLRDVVVSVFQKQGRPAWETPSWYRVVGGVLDTALSGSRWAQEPNVMASRYETFSRDIRSEVRRIAEFTGLRATASERARIASDLSVKNQKKRIAKFDFEREGIGPESDRFDPLTQLHERHLNGGEVDKWRRELSRGEIRFVERLSGRWLTDNGYGLSTRRAPKGR